MSFPWAFMSVPCSYSLNLLKGPRGTSQIQSKGCSLSLIIRPQTESQLVEINIFKKHWNQARARLPLLKSANACKYAINKAARAFGNTENMKSGPVLIYFWTELIWIMRIRIRGAAPHVWWSLHHWFCYFPGFYWCSETICVVEIKLTRLSAYRSLFMPWNKKL